MVKLKMAVPKAAANNSAHPVVNGTIQIEDRFLLTSLASVGYDTYSATAELVDNSVDSGASKCEILYDPTTATLIIKDNGSGMSYDNLLKAMNLGYNRVYSSIDIGYFGTGMKSAIINLINSEDSNSYATIETNDGYESTILTWYPVKSVREFTIESSQQDLKKGTIITIYGVNRFQVASMKRNFGVIFYPIIKSDSFFLYINGDKVEGNDPLYRYSNKTKTNFVNATVKSHPIKIEACLIDNSEVPHSWEKQTADTHKWAFAKGGIYVIYGGRYIETGGTLKAIAQHPKFSRTRIEFTIPKDLTEVFGVKFNKTSGLDLDLKKDRNEPLSDLIRKLRDMMNWTIDVRDGKVNASEEDISDIKEFTKKLNEAATKARIPKPKPELENGRKPKADPQGEKPETPKGEIPKTEPEKDKKEPKTNIAKHQPYDIRFDNLGSTAVFWHLGYSNDQFIITINDSHVFYTDIWVNMNDTSKEFIVLLLGALAVAQYESTKKDEISNIRSEFFWEDFWSMVSIKLKHFIVN